MFASVHSYPILVTALQTMLTLLSFDRNSVIIGRISISDSKFQIAELFWGI